MAGGKQMSDEFNIFVGQRLRTARKQRGWSLGEVEAHTDGEFKASVVGAYERGERAISAQRLVRLADAYRINATELLPLSTGKDPAIDLNALAAEHSDDLVDRYLAAIQLLRKRPGDPEVRQADRAVMTSLIRTGPPAVTDRTSF